MACMHVRCSPNARFTILFSHGNAIDLGQMSSFYLGLGTRFVESKFPAQLVRAERLLPPAPERDYYVIVEVFFVN